eukprot:gene11781-24695_t
MELHGTDSQQVQTQQNPIQHSFQPRTRIQSPQWWMGTPIYLAIFLELCNNQKPALTKEQEVDLTEQYFARNDPYDYSSQQNFDAH